jgi:hypothetical protein
VSEPAGALSPHPVPLPARREGTRLRALHFVLMQVATTAPLAGYVVVGAAALVIQLAIGWRGRRELVTLAAFGAGGYALEALHAALGQVHWGTPLAPPWVVIVWLALGAARSRTLDWVTPAQAALGGALLSPLSFFLADAAGVLSLASPFALTLGSIAATSGTLLYVLFRFAREVTARRTRATRRAASARRSTGSAASGA